MKEGRQEYRGYKQIKKIDFLIHPGFIYENLYPRDKKDEQGLLDLFHAYLIRAQEIPDDEVICAIAPKVQTEIEQDRQTRNDDYYYNKLLEDLQSILGDRLIVFSDDHGLALVSTGYEDTHAAPKFLEELKQVLNNRGMDFDRNTLTEAYGEYMFNCVQTVAERINEAGRFTAPTIIRAKLTEYITEHGYSRKEVKNAQKDHDNSNSKVRIEF